MACPFRAFRLPAEVILWAVGRCLCFAVSFCDLEWMLAGRAVRVYQASLYL